MWLGYVGIPEGHPWHGMPYSSIPVRCHGGLTYSKLQNENVRHSPETAGHWWVGFDCGHSGDLVPGDKTLIRDYFKGIVSPEVEEMIAQLEEDFRRDGIYRDVHYVKTEILRIVEQAANVS